MCSIVGIVSEDEVNQEIYDALMVLQHRGQDAAGMATCDGLKINIRKSNGLVCSVFKTRHMVNLAGNFGIGHTRYPTAGDSNRNESQPFYVNSPYGIALAHNGNLTNARELKEHLFKTDLRHINTNSDSEVLLNVFAHELDDNIIQKLQPNDIFMAMEKVHARCKGGYAAVAIVVGKGLVAFRDPLGIRPLIVGVKSEREYMVASESVALKALGFTPWRDVYPGETIFIGKDGTFHSSMGRDSHSSPPTPCLFEFVYLARPDSVIDGVSVHKSRQRMGEKLANKIKRLNPDNDIDVVIPIPTTSRTSALIIAKELDLEYTEGFVKNRYFGRTFIMPGQQIRQKSVREKLNAIDLEFRGKNVLLVDDSIVRGTTSKQIIEMAREAGAKKVYFASASPPVRYPNVYGIDMPTRNELIAHGKPIKEIQEEIGADWLVYQDLDDLEDAVRCGNPKIKTFESSCFSGEYIVGNVDEEYLTSLSQHRGENRG